MKKKGLYFILLLTMFLSSFSVLNAAKVKEYRNHKFKNEFYSQGNEEIIYYSAENRKPLNGKVKLYYDNEGFAEVIEAEFKNGKPIGNYLEYILYGNKQRIKNKEIVFKDSKILSYENNKFITQNIKYNKEGKFDGPYIKISAGKIINAMGHLEEKLLLEYCEYKNGSIVSPREVYVLDTNYEDRTDMTLYKITFDEGIDGIETTYFLEYNETMPSRGLNVSHGFIESSLRTTYKDKEYYNEPESMRKDLVRYRLNLFKNENNKDESENNLGILVKQTETRKYKKPNRNINNLETTYILQEATYAYVTDDYKLKFNNISREFVFNTSVLNPSNEVIINDYMNGDLKVSQKTTRENFKNFYYVYFHTDSFSYLPFKDYKI